MSAMTDTTLDEPVSVTLKRELRAIGDKMYKVVLPNSEYSKAELRNCKSCKHSSLTALKNASVRRRLGVQPVCDLVNA